VCARARGRGFIYYEPPDKTKTRLIQYVLCAFPGIKFNRYLFNIYGDKHEEI